MINELIHSHDDDVTVAFQIHDVNCLKRMYQTVDQIF